MAMSRKQLRTTVIVAALVILTIPTGLVLYALSDSIVFFYTPSEVSQKGVKPGTRLRLGGLVQDGSVDKSGGHQVAFRITDTENDIQVTYTGVLPDLFREGQGVVAEGELDGNGVFVADTVMAKHDENYMPREVADALKEKGVWQEQGASAATPEKAQP